MSTIKKISRECAYCGEPATTDDHIPPQALLIDVPKSKKPNVPSCKDCNNDASDDDEYFRDVILKYHRVADRPEAQPAIEKMFRAFSMLEKKRYAQATLKSFAELRAETTAGIDLGIQSAYSVDASRFMRASERYVRGLYFHQHKIRVPEDHAVHIDFNVESFLEKQDYWASMFSSGPIHTIKEHVFWYKCASPTDCTSSSIWLLVFFDSFPILGFIRPKTS
jgi:hypothetical protein